MGRLKHVFSDLVERLRGSTPTPKRPRSPSTSPTSVRRVEAEPIEISPTLETPSQPLAIGQPPSSRPSDPPSEPSEAIQTPPQSFAQTTAVPIAPTFRQTVAATPSIAESPATILAGARRDFLELLANSASETAAQTWFLQICRSVIRRELEYEYHGYHPSCEFVTGLGIQYMQVNHGTPWNETEFAITVNEMYYIINPQSNRNHAICTPDLMFVASALGPPYRISTGSTQHGIDDDGQSTPSRIQRRIKKRQRIAQRAFVGLDLDFQAASIAGEFKTKAFFLQLCQLLAYMVQLFDINGCRLGLTFNSGWFNRFFMGTNKRIYMETSSADSWGQVWDMTDARRNLSNRRQYFAHNLANRPAESTTLNETAACTLIKYLQSAASVLVDLPFTNVTWTDIAAATSVADATRGGTFFAFPAHEGSEANAAMNRRIIARGARPDLDPALGVLEPNAHRFLASLKRRSPQQRPAGDQDPPDDDSDDGNNDDSPSPNGSSGASGNSADLRSERRSYGGYGGDGGRNGSHGATAGIGHSTRHDAGGHDGATGQAMRTRGLPSGYASEATISSEALDLASMDHRPDIEAASNPDEPVLGYTQRVASTSIQGTSTSSLPPTSDDDDEVDRPTPHDPIKPALERIGLQIELCSPDTMAMMVDRYLVAVSHQRRRRAAECVTVAPSPRAHHSRSSPEIEVEQASSSFNPAGIQIPTSFDEKFVKKR